MKHLNSLNKKRISTLVKPCMSEDKESLLEIEMCKKNSQNTTYTPTSQTDVWQTISELPEPDPLSQELGDISNILSRFSFDIIQKDPVFRINLRRYFLKTLGYDVIFADKALIQNCVIKAGVTDMDFDMKYVIVLYKGQYYHAFDVRTCSLLDKLGQFKVSVNHVERSGFKSGLFTPYMLYGSISNEVKDLIEKMKESKKKPSKEAIQAKREKKKAVKLKKNQVTQNLINKYIKEAGLHAPNLQDEVKLAMANQNFSSEVDYITRSVAGKNTNSTKSTMVLLKLKEMLVQIDPKAADKNLNWVADVFLADDPVFGFASSSLKRYSPAGVNKDYAAYALDHTRDAVCNPDDLPSKTCMLAQTFDYQMLASTTQAIFINIACAANNTASINYAFMGTTPTYNSSTGAFGAWTYSTYQGYAQIAAVSAATKVPAHCQVTITPLPSSLSNQGSYIAGFPRDFMVTDGSSPWPESDNPSYAALIQSSGFKVSKADQQMFVRNSPLKFSAGSGTGSPSVWNGPSDPVNRNQDPSTNMTFILFTSGVDPSWSADIRVEFGVSVQPMQGNYVLTGKRAKMGMQTESFLIALDSIFPNFEFARPEEVQNFVSAMMDSDSNDIDALLNIAAKCNIESKYIYQQAKMPYSKLSYNTTKALEESKNDAMDPVTFDVNLYDFENRMDAARKAADLYHIDPKSLYTSYGIPEDGAYVPPEPKTVSPYVTALAKAATVAIAPIMAKVFDTPKMKGGR